MPTKRRRDKPRRSEPGEPAPKAPDLSHIAEDLRGLAVPIGDVTADPRNGRKHDEQNIASIVASLRQFGQVKPIVVNRHTRIIEAGNGTWEAARRLGWTWLAVVWVQHDPTTAIGYAIADNRTAELAGWDDVLLAELLGEARSDARLGGLLDAMLLDRLQKPTGTAQDDTSAVPEQWKIVVDCATEDDQKELFGRMQKEGRKCRLLTL